MIVLAVIASIAACAFFGKDSSEVDGTDNLIINVEDSNGNITEIETDEIKESIDNGQKTITITDSYTDVAVASIDFNGLVSAARGTNNVNVKINALDTTDDGKYLFASITAGGEAGGYIATLYKENVAGAEWKTLLLGRQISYCSGYSDEVVEWIRQYSHEDDEFSGDEGYSFITCLEDSTGDYLK